MPLCITTITVCCVHSTDSRGSNCGQRINWIRRSRFTVFLAPCSAGFNYILMGIWDRLWGKRFGCRRRWWEGIADFRSTARTFLAQSMKSILLPGLFKLLPGQEFWSNPTAWILKSLKLLLPGFQVLLPGHILEQSWSKIATAWTFSFGAIHT